MPMPLSLTVSVPAAVSGISVTDISSEPMRPGLAIASKRSFSQASEAFDISSRRKISLCEYSEWITNRSTCLVSAWNSLICGCVSVVMALQSLSVDQNVAGIAPTRSGVAARYFKLTCFGLTGLHGEERHSLDRLGGSRRQFAGRAGQVRRCRHDRLGGHVERGRAFAGRQRKRSLAALWNCALDAAGRPLTPAGVRARTVLLELRSGPADIRAGRRRLGLRGRGPLAPSATP